MDMKAILCLFEISDRPEVRSNWKQKSKYIYGKSGKGKFENRFNLAGGRWITVYGLSYKPSIDDIRGYVITSDRKQISSFESSSKLLNQIYKINLDTYLANTMWLFWWIVLIENVEDGEK